MQFLHHVFQGGRLGHAVPDGEAESVRLPLVVIGILPQQHGLDVCVRGVAETVVDVVHVGVDDVVPVFLNEEGADLFIALVLKEGGKRFFPVTEIDHNASNTVR